MLCCSRLGQLFGFVTKRWSRPRSPERELSVFNSTPVPCEPSGSQGPCQLTRTNEESPQPADRLHSSQAVTWRASNLDSAAKDPSPPAQVTPARPEIASIDIVEESFVLDPEEISPTLSGVSAFTHAALEVAKEFATPCPPLEYAITSLLIAIKGFAKVSQVQDDFTYAARKMRVIKTTCRDHRSELETSESLQACMRTVTQAVQMVEQMIVFKFDRGVLQRIWEYPNDIKAISNALRMLGDVADHFDVKVALSTHSMVQDQVLDKLTFVESAQFLSIQTGRQCTEGTRTELLTNLLGWGTATSGVPMVCLLNGPAGFGKSTIAYTMCSILKGINLLGGSFFCSRDGDDKRRSTRSIFSTLARSLASQDHGYASALIQVLQRNIGAGGFVAVEQLTNLIIAPIRNVYLHATSPATPIRVFVIDALDECADDDQTIYDLICMLLDGCHGLPLKFLITSRPESRINRAFEQADLNRYVHLRLEDVPEDVAKGDVLTYLWSELNRYAKTCRVPDSWPPAAQVEILARQAGALFIYTSTACKYISNFNDDAAQRLKELTAPGTRPLRGIDSMYEFVLGHVRQSKADTTWEIARRCLQVIVHLRQPLSLGDLAAVMDVECKRLRIALEGLQSVLHIPFSDHHDCVSVFHASFPDYIADEKLSRQKVWFIESVAVHRFLLQRCMSVIKAELHFNISSSRTSYAANAEEQTQHSISGIVRYACLHCIDHLVYSGNLPAHGVAELSKLLCERFLYWLEALSITTNVRKAPPILTRLLDWITEHSPVMDVSDASAQETAVYQDFRQFAADARAFVNTYALPIEKSCPHIYLSALSTTPRTSKIWSMLSNSFKDLPCIITRQPRDPPRFLFVLRGHEGNICSVALSPDRMRVVSGSEDLTIRLWDVATGAAIGEPLRGHQDWILSVAFSPDGTRIVSGSYDRTIRLWDSATGAAIGEPLRGHEDRILSVAFSPDGTQIASGSYDCTIRLWDVATGSAIRQPLRGHEGWISSVAFSPDGKRIASGSYDCTLCLWDVATAKAIRYIGPQRGHKNRIPSVIFSPDGMRMVSGSCDRTICIWDATTGLLIGEPIPGHASEVWSVGLSSDGTRIVSGSSDRTVRLWDAATGVAVGAPLRGHEDWVSSVAYSPDGLQIGSGSYDLTIRLWDVATGTVIGAPLRGHEDWILSLAFSPDGTRIVSGSYDRTIRLWDTAAGAAVGEPLRGHEDRINSVAFSPNGTQIVSGSNDRTIRLWNVATGAAIGEPLRGHEDWILSVAFSPDGMSVVSGSYDCSVRLWDVAAGLAIGSPLRGHNSRIMSVAFSPDGMRIASGSYNSIVTLWDVATGSRIENPRTKRAHKDRILSVAFSPDGSQIVSGSYDRTIRLWDAATGSIIRDIGKSHSHGDRISSVAFSPSGMHIVSSSYDRTVRIWDATTGLAVEDPLRGHKKEVWSVGLSSDGTRIVSGSSDRTIHLWDVSTGVSAGAPLPGRESSFLSTASSPDGTRTVSGSADGTLRLWNMATEAAIGKPLRGHYGRISSVAFSADGTRFASGSSERTIRLWDVATKKATGNPLRGHTDGIASLAFSPDGTRIISGSFDCTIRLWDTTTGEAVGEPLRGHEDKILSVAFSPDGTRIISSSSDRTVRLWEVVTGIAVGAPLRGHARWVRSAAFSPDGTQIVSGSDDRTIRLWKTATRAAVGEPLRGHEDRVLSVAFSPDGTRIISSSYDCTIRLWDVATGSTIGKPLRGHTSFVWSVAFAADGTRIVSGSHDGTIRLWAVVSREAMGNHLHSHEERVESVASDCLPIHAPLHATGKSLMNPQLPENVVVPITSAFGPARQSLGTAETENRVVFSSNDTHSTCIESFLKPGCDPQDSFTLDEDGWLRGPNNELFLWILPEYRLGLRWPRTKAIVGTHSVTLDLSRFVHGEAWTNCFTPESAAAEDQEHTVTIAN